MCVNIWMKCLWNCFLRGHRSLGFNGLQVWGLFFFFFTFASLNLRSTWLLSWCVQRKTFGRPFDGGRWLWRHHSLASAGTILFIRTWSVGCESTCETGACNFQCVKVRGWKGSYSFHGAVRGPETPRVSRDSQLDPGAQAAVTVRKPHFTCEPGSVQQVTCVFLHDLTSTFYCSLLSACPGSPLGIRISDPLFVVVQKCLHLKPRLYFKGPFSPSQTSSCRDHLYLRMFMWTFM